MTASFAGLVLHAGPNGRAQTTWNQAIAKRVETISITLSAIEFVKMAGLVSVFEKRLQVGLRFGNDLPWTYGRGAGLPYS